MGTTRLEERLLASLGQLQGADSVEIRGVFQQGILSRKPGFGAVWCRNANRAQYQKADGSGRKVWPAERSGK